MPKASGDPFLPTLQKLMVLREVVERQSLTQAARELGVSQPAVSGHLNDLQRYFGAPLMERQGRGVIVTEAGKAVYAYALEILAATDQVRDAVRLTSAAAAGSATVGATETPATYWLPQRLASFRNRHPRTELSVHVGTAPEMWERTRHGTVDFAIVGGPQPPDDLRVVVYSEEPLALVCAPDDRLAGRRVERAALRSRRLVSVTRRQGADRITAYGLSPAHVVMRLANSEGVKYAVRTGLGVAIMYRCAVERELEEGSLAEIEVAGVSPSRLFYLVSSPRKRLSAMQHSLLNYLLR